MDMSSKQAEPDRFSGQDTSNTVWSMATPMPRDEPLLHAPSVAASLQDMQPQNSSNRAWAPATLQAAHAPSFGFLWSASMPRLPEFDLQGLANISWPSTTLQAASKALFLAAENRLEKEFEPRETASREEACRYTNHICQIVWSFSFSRCLTDELGHVLRHRLLHVGRNLDRRSPPEKAAKVIPQASHAMPAVLLRLRGILVVHKPPGWEVDAKGQMSGTGLYLSRYIQHQAPTSQVTRLAAFEYGLVHRLDVPSSGLILAGTTFEGLALLQWQMHTYAICREYAVLVAGCWPASRQRVSMPVQDFLSGQSFVDEHGRPAETHVKVAAHSRLSEGDGDQASLIIVSICTGRRHQIRVHAQWQGHPTVTDEKPQP
ncbi:unnamed protein product [Effrenium voratum]|uniref:Pseudouridine synthase RsuA/RluA-like domain-containing protein n=1 Tax=Effrenium voratum TaxID=2562239 RepID=A0AA36MZB4_9DINO|nr:unnamed protein product [Effrenium voratum]CAJ1430224.1 unnamed protein product [Effrenium voratum]